MQQRQSMLRIIGTFLSSRGGAGLSNETMHILPLCSGTKRHSVESRSATRSLAKHLQMVVRILGSFTRADMLILCSQSARQRSFVFDQKRLNINTHRTKTEKVEHGAETTSHHWQTDRTRWRNVYRCKQRYLLSLRKT